MQTYISVRGVPIYWEIEQFLEAMTWHSFNPRFLSSRKAMAPTCTKF